MSEHRNTASARAAFARIGSQLALLGKMNVVALRDKYEEVFGKATRSRDKDYLRKRIAYRFQELAETQVRNEQSSNNTSAPEYSDNEGEQNPQQSNKGARA